MPARLFYEPMLLDLSQIQESLERLERVYQPEALGPRDADFVVADRVHVRLDIQKDGDRFRLVGTVQTRLGQTCSRCLEPFDRDVDVAFDLLYLPHTANTGDEASEVEADDLSVAYYRDDQIDLRQLLGEQLYLTLPMKPLCDPACRGLCVDCGHNLNLGGCGCRHVWTDPRWAALETLRKDTTQG